MSLFIELDCAEAKLSMADLGLATVKAVLRENRQLLWNCKGEVKEVPRHVLEDLVRNYEDGQRALADARLAELLEHAHCIYWDQTVPLAEVKVPLNPVPKVTHPPGGARGEDAPAE